MNIEAKPIPTYQSFNDKEILTQSIKHYITSIVILGLGIRSFNEDGPTTYQLSSGRLMQEVPSTSTQPQLFSKSTMQ